MERPGVAGEIVHLTSGPLTLDEVGRTLARLLGVRTLPLAVPKALLQLAATLVEGAGFVTGRAPVFDRDKARELVASWPVSIEKAERLLGFRPQVGFEEGARDAIAWCRAEKLLR